MHIHAARAFALDAKLVTAIAVAAIGVGAAAWSLTSTRSTREVRAPAREQMQRDTGGPQQRPDLAAVTGVNYNFAPASNDQQRAELLQNYTSTVNDALQSLTDRTRSFEERQALTTAINTALQPYLSGDVEGVDASITELGGQLPPPEEMTEQRLDRRKSLVNVFKNASLDTENLTVRAVPAGQSLQDAYDPSQDPRDTGYMANLGIMIGGAFPELEEAGRNGVDRVEVAAPIKLKGVDGPEGMVDLGVVMGYNPQQRRWQPMGFNFYIRSPEAQDEVGKLLRGGR